MTESMQFEIRASGTTGLRVGLARLDRPAQLNALTLEMCEAMLVQFRTWASDESIACVMLAANGDKGFCAGGDVAAVVRSIRSGGPQRFVLGDTFFEVEYHLDSLIHAYPKPFISWSHGVNMGGGVGLSVGASDRIVSEGSRIAMPEIHIGLFPDVGGGWFLNRLPGHAGLLMAMTGAVINEADALFAGLADHAIERRRQPAFIDRLTDLDWDAAPEARRAQVRQLCRTFAAEAPLALPDSPLRAHHEQIREICLCPDPVAFLAALQDAAAKEKWFSRPLDNLVHGSPTAASVTFRHMQRCRPLGIRQVLAADLTVARQCQRHHDFPEGVRAVLIDKSRDAKWSPARLQDVPAALVDEFFQPV